MALNKIFASRDSNNANDGILAFIFLFLSAKDSAAADKLNALFNALHSHHADLIFGELIKLKKSPLCHWLRSYPPSACSNNALEAASSAHGLMQPTFQDLQWQIMTQSLPFVPLLASLRDVFKG
eukprot:7530695-Ditylum_brightwellii.AAC.1